MTLLTLFSTSYSVPLHNRVAKIPCFEEAPLRLKIVYHLSCDSSDASTCVHPTNPNFTFTGAGLHCTPVHALHATRIEDSRGKQHC